MPDDLMTIATVAVLYAAVVVSPGPNFALVSRMAISGSLRAAKGATLGMALAATFYAVLSMTGLSLVLSRIGWLAGVAQIAGGMFLIYLGVRSWMQHAPSASDNLAPRTNDTFARGFRVGMLVNLSNPKGIAFFVSLYAVAIPATTGLGAKSAILLIGFSMEILWYGAVVMIMSSGLARAIYDRFGIWIERAIGTILILFGVRLLVNRET